MIHLTPYASPVYFFLLFIGCLPVMISFLVRGKRLPLYEGLLTFFFLWLSFGGPELPQGLALLGYLVWQTILTAFYNHYRKKKNQSGIFFLTVFLSILPLIFVKVTPFYNGKSSIFGFLGISYLTFKAVQTIMEIRDGVLKNYSIKTFVRFLLFFPTISSGPIDRYRRFEKDIDNPVSKEKYLDLLQKGVWNISLGFLYKVILGYYLGTVLLPGAESLALRHGTFSFGTLGYMYVYALYLFFDFAGYSLFAVGSSYLLGVETPVNFDKPFLSKNIKEFWNRWHMSLSFWFRDYVYMRLMFLILKKKWFKSRVTASNIGYLGLFLLMGFWHGLTWYYIVYGLYHALWIILNDSFIRFKKKHPEKFVSTVLTRGISTVLTFHGVALSFLIFSGFLDKLWFK